MGYYHAKFHDSSYTQNGDFRTCDREGRSLSYIRSTPQIKFSCGSYLQQQRYISRDIFRYIRGIYLIWDPRMSGTHEQWNPGMYCQLLFQKHSKLYLTSNFWDFHERISDFCIHIITPQNAVFNLLALLLSDDDLLGRKKVK